MPPDREPIGAFKARILIVDDDPLFLEVAAPTLINAGYAVTIAASGAESLSALSSNRFGLLIMDCGLRDPNELAILDRLERGSDRCAVMILSSRSGEWHERVMKLYGAQIVISKPIDTARLLAVVGQMLNAGNIRHG